MLRNASFSVMNIVWNICSSYLKMLNPDSRMDKFNTGLSIGENVQKHFLREIVKGVEIAKCITKSHTRQPAPTAEKNAKFPSNQIQVGQCTAENVTLNEDPREDIKLTS
jgi:hypothetical protein